MEASIRDVDSSDPDQDRLEATADNAPLAKTAQHIRNALNLPNRLITKGYSKIFDKMLKDKLHFQAMTEEEQQAHIEKVGRRTTVGAYAVAAFGALYFAVTKQHVLDSVYVGGGNTGTADTLATSATEAPTANTQVKLMTYEKALTVDGSGGTPGGLLETPELSRQHEMDFLSTNGRVRNDFNNIPVDTLNDPANRGHFPGYTALREQFEKSPDELAAQLRQIQAIEMANGVKLDIIPDEFRDLAMKPGEGQEAYIARLGEAIHNNSDLHDILTQGALKYIEVNARPLQDLTSNYSANYIVIENGKPSVRFDDFVQSADPNDKVLLLSDTEGIRFPCGQCIKIYKDAPVAQQPVYAPQGGPVYRAPSVPEPTPQPRPSAPPAAETPAPTPIPEVPTIPVVPEVPVIPEPEPELPTPSEVKGDRQPTFMDTIQGPGELRPPARVDSEVRTSGGGRVIGDGNKVSPPVTERFRGGPTSAEAGASTADSNTTTIDTSGPMTNNNDERTNSGDGAPTGPAE